MQKRDGKCPPSCNSNRSHRHTADVPDLVRGFYELEFSVIV